MPVGSDEHFAEKKRILTNAAGYTVFKPSLPLNGEYCSDFDLDSTIRILQDSEFVVADLSLERPSCYYELGLAQALGKRTFLIAEMDTPLHQAYGRNSVRFYRDLGHYQRIISEILSEALSLAVEESV